MGGIYPKTYQRSRTKRPLSTPTGKHNQKKEESIQIRVSSYIKKNYPQAILIGDFAAGLDLTDGQRIKMMKMRSEDGQPDISFDYPSRGYHGLRIELKKDGTVIYKREGSLRKQGYSRRLKNGMIKKGDHLAEQVATLNKYNKLGYLGRFAIGYESAIRLIDWYMERPIPQELF
jgi:hypothetical protein